MSCTIVVVAPTGPPPVMMKTWSNTWNEEISEMVVTKNVVGASIGQVMVQKRCQALAPSMSAASPRFSGISCRPAR